MAEEGTDQYDAMDSKYGNSYDSMKKTREPTAVWKALAVLVNGRVVKRKTQREMHVHVSLSSAYAK